MFRDRQKKAVIEYRSHFGLVRVDRPDPISPEKTSPVEKNFTEFVERVSRRYGIFQTDSRHLVSYVSSLGVVLLFASHVERGIAEL